MLRNAIVQGLAVAVFAVGVGMPPVQAEDVAVAFASAPVERLDDVHALRFRAIQTIHFRLLIDNAANHPDAAAIHRLLEATHDEFFTAFDGGHFKLRPLAARVDWVCFDTHDQFVRYARLADRRDMSHLRGYYSARTNRVALLLDEHALATTARSARMTHSQDESDPTDHRTMPRRIDRRISHEAVHQLAFNTGLYRRGVMYPLWAGEGLATNFERITGDPLGPAYDNPARRARLLDAARAERLIPLRRFAVLVRVPRDPGAVADCYAQAWGLFRYLYLHHPKQLSTYLAEAAAAEPGWRDPRALTDAFTRAFGPIAPLDRRFTEWVDQLPAD